MKPVTRKTRIRRVNREVDELLRDKYWDSLPIDEVSAICEKHGFLTIWHEFDCIPVGSEGWNVAHLGENVWMTFRWIRAGDRNQFVMSVSCTTGAAQ